MPELPEVEVIVRELRRRIVGQMLTGAVVNPDSDFKPARRLTLSAQGRIRRFSCGHGLPAQIYEVQRRGKWIQWKLASGMEIWIHLGMTGQLAWSEPSAGWGRHEHLSFKFQRLSEALRYRDIRKFGNICWVPPGSRRPRRLDIIAPDPFELAAEDFIRRARPHQGAVKSLLLNQRFLSGLGNIYANESLFRAGIRPVRRAYRIRSEEWAKLHQEICAVLSEAIERGGSSIDDYVHTDGSQGSFQEQHRVYNRAGEPCQACGHLIRRKVIAGRSSFYCSQCQK